MKILKGTGDLSDTANWYDDTNTITLHASTNITLDTTGKLGATFTAPNTSNYSKGTLCFLVAKNNTSTITAELQEFNGATWSTVASRAIATTLMQNGTWVRFDWSYQFTTTSSGYYRINFKSDTSSSACTLAADSGGSLVAYQSFDDRTGIPSSETAYALCEAGSTAILTMESNVTLVGTEFSTSSTARSIGYSLYAGHGVTIKQSRSTSSTVTIQGNVWFDWDSVFDYGTGADPIPWSVKAIFNKTNIVHWVHYANSKRLVFGSYCTSELFKTTYVSGSGTTASPMVVADAVDWDVDTEIRVLASSNNTTNYNELEEKVIKTKVSSTEFVLSNTVGGAESGLTYSHTDATIISVTRNISWTTSSNSYHTCTHEGSSTYFTDEYWHEEFSRHHILNGSGNRSSYYIYGTEKIGNMAVTGVGSGRAGLYFINISEQTHTNCFVDRTSNDPGSAQDIVPVFVSGATNVILDGFVLTRGRGASINFAGAYNVRVTNSEINASNTSGYTTWTAVKLQLSGGITFENCNINANYYGVYFGSVSDITFVNCNLGTKGTNRVANLLTPSGSLNTVLLQNCYFGGTLISGYTSQADGSEIVIADKENVSYFNFGYLRNGIWQLTGASLDDTETRTTGNYSLRLAPANANPGLSYSFDVAITANSLVSIPLYVWENSTFVGDSGASVVVDLYLPGDLTPTATRTLTKTTDKTSQDANATISASYTGSIDGVATVVITAKSATAGAYCYFGDIFNGGNTITGFRTIKNGKISSLMVLQIADPIAIAQSVWSAVASANNTAGTMGAIVNAIFNFVQVIFGLLGMKK